MMSNPVQTDSLPFQISEGEAFSVLNYFHVMAESPDGQRVAYTRFPKGPHEGLSGGAEVVVCDRAGTNHRKIGEASDIIQHRGVVPTWVDDEHLVYSTSGDGSGPLNVVSIDSGRERTLDGGLDNYSPELRRSYYHVGLDGQPAVGFVDLETGRNQIVVTMEQMQAFAESIQLPFEPEGLAHSYIAPGGGCIAFRVGRKPNNIIILADPDGGNLRLFGLKMMHWQFLDEQSFFGHDDVFVGDKHMRRWDFEGNIIEELSGPGCHGTISPDGQWIVTESWYRSDPVDIFLYRRGDVEPTCILARGIPPWETRAHVHPTFSRDGRRVYFNYNTQGSRGSQVYCCDLDPLIS
jgi:hypothetical protein